ncbi:MAG: Rossmann-like and DUF2520 domain-containing protein [Flavobacteriales bacterium]
MNDIQNITIIGSGNIATQVALALYEKGIAISQVWSRSLSNASLLANQVNAEAINDTLHLTPSDLYIVAISDDAISDFISALPLSTPVVHTSGNTALVERNNREISGVFYPLQTFSKTRKANWKTIPICLEANSSVFLKQLTQLAELLSGSVKEISSAQRKVLHAAAVIACNFTTHLAAISEQFLEENQLSLDLIQPLMAQTFSNIHEGNVKAIQTGPAVRQDHGTIEAHLQLLTSHPDFQALYLALSKHIIKYHHGQ